MDKVLDKLMLPGCDDEDVLQEAIRKVFEYGGLDPYNEGLRDTPKRVINAWKKLCEGYSKKAEDILVTDFNEFGDNYNGMVLLKDIEFYSTCEHHLLPFFGKAHFAYIPDKKVVGVSKIARLVDMHARRLQIQERMTTDIVNDFNRIVKPNGCALVLEAQHFCMKSRGVEKQNSIMFTSSMTGLFEKQFENRQEFMNLIRS